MNKSITIIMLIDALGWDYIKDRPFLDDIVKTKRPVKSALGFSSGVIPSLLTGRNPKEHKHWSLYRYDPQKSPFKWTKLLHWLPKRILNSRISRKIVEEITKKFMDYTGYFETYLVPVEKLYLYEISENRSIYTPGGIREGKSIFDILVERNVDYKCYTYPISDKDIFAKAKDDIRSSDRDYYFLYFSESDAYLHRACKDNDGVYKMVSFYEQQIREVYKTAKNKFDDVNLFVFSDHSMSPVYKSFDLQAEIDALGVESPSDYVAFLDSTMGRFWFMNDDAREKITSLLREKEYGRILTEDEKKEEGIDFENNMYGEVIFLMENGSVINPCDMGRTPPEGMHGYAVDDGKMDAILVSNKEVQEEVRTVRDFYGIMEKAISCKP